MKKPLEQIFVKPAVAGQVIRDEHRRKPYQLAAEGELKPRSTYWIRRIRMGDVVLCEPGKSQKIEEKPSDKKSGKGKDK